jgi:hypothetical protein
LALLRFLPSYQNLAWWIAPLTVTRLDQAVRPPGLFDIGQHIGLSCPLVLFCFHPSHFRGDSGLWARLTSSIRDDLE